MFARRAAPTSTFEYDFDRIDPAIETTFSESSADSKKKRIFGIACVSLLVLVATASATRLDLAMLNLLNSDKGAEWLPPEAHKKAGIMTLGKPYDRLRDVVFDQPVRETDVKFFWQTRDSGSDVMVQLLSECFRLTLSSSSGKGYENENEVQVHRYNGGKFVNVDTTTVKGVERAKQLDLVSSGMVDVIISPHIRQASDLFTEDNQGRMFAFFRHPIEREYARAMKGQVDNNWMTRLLINKTKGELNFKDLGQAKKVIREKCVVGLLDEHMHESLERIQNYFGWAGSDICVDEYARKLPYEQLGDNIDGDDAAWQLLHKHNEYDVQLYEFARSVFRGQKQTILPLKKQLQLAEGD